MVYPPFRSSNDQRSIIREWQAAMNPENRTQEVCAVCAQVFEGKSRLHDVTPSQMISATKVYLKRRIHLSTISNYSVILHPRGMTSLDCSLADSCMCSKCQGALVKKTPVLPKDVQYYGWSEIPDDVRDAIRTASPLEVMIVALCRAAVITHHYQSKSFQASRSFKTAYKFTEAIVSQK